MIYIFAPLATGIAHGTCQNMEERVIEITFRIKSKSPLKTASRNNIQETLGALSG